MIPGPGGACPILNNMREIERTIVSAIIWSADGKILMGKKDPSRGGVYSDCWHLPGGGVDEGETMEQALVREVKQEVGIDISQSKLTLLPYVGNGTAEKILKETSEKVLCHMEFNRFEVRLDKPADLIELHLDDDLIEARWFSKGELPDVKQIPGGREFFIEMGYIGK